MIERASQDELEWLRSLSSFEGEGEGARVADLLPSDYAAYVRLFHPFVPWECKAADLIPAERRRSWREMAAEVGAVFHGELTWESLEAAVPIHGEGRRFQVMSGEMDLATRRSLTAVLSEYTGAVRTFHSYSLTAAINDKEPSVIAAPVHDAEAVLQYAREHDLAVRADPEYIWPEDRSWVLCTNYDLTSTYLAVPEALGGALAANSILEVVQVAAETRVDGRADRINTPGRDRR